MLGDAASYLIDVLGWDAEFYSALSEKECLEYIEYEGLEDEYNEWKLS